MDKRVIFAVAGAGKTTRIISGLNLEKRFLIITYTDNNLANLRCKIITKFGFFPKNISLYSYFTFLHNFCFKPFLLIKTKTQGINFQQPPDWTMRVRRTEDSYYIDKHRRLYHNRIAKLLEVRGIITDVIQRIEKYFDVLCFDEVQDFGGHDFNLISTLCKGNVNSLYVGDFYQHTFDTSRDGSTNKNLHNDFEKYKTRFQTAGLIVDTTSLVKSYRCSETVCQFIRDYMGIEIYSHTGHIAEVKLVEKQIEVDTLHACPNTVKLFYKEHGKYGCYSQNWGGSKGQDHYNNVCVVLTEVTYQAYANGKLKDLPPQTKNKLYVACSRSRGNLYLVREHLMRKFKVF